MSGRGNSTTEPTNGVKMLGMDRNTGKLLSGTDHIRQSIVDILTTPLGTRVRCRNMAANYLILLIIPQIRRLLCE